MLRWPPEKPTEYSSPSAMVKVKTVCSCSGAASPARSMTVMDRRASQAAMMEARSNTGEENPRSPVQMLRATGVSS